MWNSRIYIRQNRNTNERANFYPKNDLQHRRFSQSVYKRVLHSGLTRNFVTTFRARSNTCTQHDVLVQCVLYSYEFQRKCSAKDGIQWNQNRNPYTCVQHTVGTILNYAKIISQLKDKRNVKSFYHPATHACSVIICAFFSE